MRWAERGGEPALLRIPRCLVEVVLGARFSPYPYPSETRDRRSCAILEPVDAPKPLWISRSGRSNWRWARIPRSSLEPSPATLGVSGPD